MSEAHTDKIIDAVITWVDGKDEAHQANRAKYISEFSGNSTTTISTGKDETRFIDNGELKYCIRSIRKFAPWIRTKHIITDNQYPDFITPDYQKTHNINIVDHSEIFRDYEWALPTFNSRTIETVLWRINDLADHFIYFNDDFVLTAPVNPDDFFKDDKVVLRGRWNYIFNYGPLALKLNYLANDLAKRWFGITRSMHLLLQTNSAKLAGYRFGYYRIPHVPQPVRKQTIQNFFNQYPEKLEGNIAYKFRNIQQFSPVYISHHLEIRNGNAILEGKKGIEMLNGEQDMQATLNRKMKNISSGQILFTCLHAMEKFSEENRLRIKEMLKELFDQN